MGKGREHRILEIPREIPMEHIKPTKGSVIFKADNAFFIEDRTQVKWANFAIGIIMFFGGIWIAYPFKVFSVPSLFEYTLMIIGFLLIINGIFKKKKNAQLILDRLNGIISYPDSFLGKPLVGPFSKLIVVIGVSGDIDGYSPTEYLKVINTFKPRKFDVQRTLSYEDPYKEWSLYVWYMDKNRPLPPGTAFDPYRQKDFERRKKLGFPRPLYPSNIPTPEATPEQQKERLIIGGW
ncbi:hypothetical protein [Tenacibaculum jejuense]|uniref:Transmembrane protein n=1 Tax=Tenacibaculum jejuense TaxID=584609 RepID=A0A238U5N3_9FLAO|nr:hypothetical protein [Tenacibaculum jejuense]SNR14447.1 conserved protein of unknown function [Tenacibaculum jejuense]